MVEHIEEYLAWFYSLGQWVFQLHCHASIHDQPAEF